MITITKRTVNCKREALRAMTLPKGKILTGREVNDLVAKGWTHGYKHGTSGHISYLINPLGNRGIMMHNVETRIIHSFSSQTPSKVYRTDQVTHVEKTGVGELHGCNKTKSETALKYLQSLHIN